jgi:DNA-binding NarL/FixJ family response regulator
VRPRAGRFCGRSARDRLGAAVSEHKPDLAVVDVRMPPSFTDEGIRAAQWIRDAHPDVGVLVLSQHVESAGAVGLVSQGGFGYLLKDGVLHVSEFLGAAERVARGGSALDPQVVASLVGGERDALGALTDREREVLSLMAEGLTSNAIAQRLIFTERTVEGHVRSVLTKLDLPAREDGHRRVLRFSTTECERGRRDLASGLPPKNRPPARAATEASEPPSELLPRRSRSRPSPARHAPFTDPSRGPLRCRLKIVSGSELQLLVGSSMAMKMPFAVVKPIAPPPV